LVAKGGTCRGVAVEDADLGAFFDKTRGCGGADSPGASGDEDSFVFQAFHAGSIVPEANDTVEFSLIFAQCERVAKALTCP
jgi:hypothetical protein